VAVSHRKPAFAATSRDTSGAQDGDKRNVLWCGVCVRAMKTHRRLELLLHSFLSSALDRGEWPATRPGRIFTGATETAILSLEDRLSPTNIPCPYEETNPDTAAVQSAISSAVCPVSTADRIACLHLSTGSLKTNSGLNKFICSLTNLLLSVLRWNLHGE